jgi:hypothetical protein
LGFSGTTDGLPGVKSDEDAPKSSINHNQSTTSDDFVVVSRGIQLAIDQKILIFFQTIKSVVVDFDGHTRADTVSKFDLESGSASSTFLPNDGYTW